MTDTAINALTSFFAPKENTEFAVFQFRQAKQNQTEDIASYLTRLRQLATTCDFSDTNRELKSQLIQGCRSNRLRRKALTDPTLTLDKLFEMARAAELADAQSSVMTGEPATESVSQIKTKNHAFKKNSVRYDESKRNATCRNCGKAWPHVGGRERCPALGQTCRGCGKLGHFSSVCRSSGPPGRPETQFGGRRPRINWVAADNPSSDSETEYLYAIRAQAWHRDAPTFVVTLDGVPIKLTADSGASVNILDEKDFDKLQPNQRLSPTTTKIMSYHGSTPLPVLGKLTLLVEHDSNQAYTDFYVIAGSSGSLLSWETSTQLHLINVVQHVQAETTPLAKEYSDLFRGLGKLKNFSVKLHIDETVTPVAQPHRRIPFHLRKQVEAQLRSDIEHGVIEKVEGATPWVSPIVVVPKPKSPGDVRVCVDMRRANTAICRERHLTPTINDIIHDLNGAKVFSKLDLNQGYNQIELDHSSRYITTFSTHTGLWRYKRLNFGISSAAEVFQNAIRETLSGLQGVLNISDDILVFGTNQEKHDTNLRACFQRLRECGLTLNAKKCVFNRRNLDFFGYTFSAAGLSADAKKVQDVINLPRPTNVSELRSLLGMANFSARFIPSYATMTQPLRALLHKDVAFSWGAEQEASLAEIRRSLSQPPTLAYFDEARQTEIFTDASPVGLGAILTQCDDEGMGRHTIAYASRSLTDVEQRYSQTEREALAIIWACEHFHLYIYGRPVRVFTDHKPLVSIFCNPLSKPPARIERWTLRLQPYAASVVYRTGCDNPADYLSRHPQHDTKPVSREEKIAEEYVNFVTNHAIPKAMTLEEVQTETKRDATLQAVKSSIQSGRWTHQSQDNGFDSIAYDAFAKVKTDLTLDVHNEVILRHNQLVIPQHLQERSVRLAHEGHQGISKTKALLREKIWFPGIDKMVESQVRSCLPCAAATPMDNREPLKMSELPAGPWQHVSIDFATVHGHYLLVMYDEYSRFPVVDIISSLTASTVIPRIDKIFSEYGVPKTLKSDNGPPFNSKEFEMFSSNLGFKHRKITPYWPRANAEVERFMRTAKKVIKTAYVEGKNWMQELYCFLRNYRATPHSTTGVPPATLLFGRPMAVKLPQLMMEEDDHNLRCHDAHQKAAMKARADCGSHAKSSTLAVGDSVLLKSPPTYSKSLTPFEPLPYEVISRKGSMITVKRGERHVTRNSSFFKPVEAEVVHGNPVDAEQEFETPAEPVNPVQQPTVEPDPIRQDDGGGNLNPQSPHDSSAEGSGQRTLLRRSHRERNEPKWLKDFVRAK